MTDKKKKKKLKYVTLVWEELPENISYYVIPREVVTKADIKMLKACHNNWINATAVDTTRADKETVDQALCTLNNILVDPSLEWINDKYRDEQAGYCGVTRKEFDEFVGKWNGYKLDTEGPRTLPRSRLYRSGFLM